MLALSAASLQPRWASSLCLQATLRCHRLWLALRMLLTWFMRSGPLCFLCESELTSHRSKSIMMCILLSNGKAKQGM